MATITEPMALDKTFNTTETTPRSQADVLAAIENAIRQGFGRSAADVSYDNTTSGLTADDVQEAIDELAAEKVDKVEGKGLSSNDFTDEDKAALDNMEFDIESTQTATGNPLTLTDAAPINAESLVVELEPKQDLHGQDAPYVGGAGYNKLNYDDWKQSTIANGTGTWENNGVTLTATSNDCFTYSSDYEKGGVSVNAGDTVKISWSADSDADGYIYIFDQNSNILGTANNETEKSKTITIPNGVTRFRFRFGVSNSGVTIRYSNIMVQVNTNETTFAPWENICPITGYTECEVDDVGKNLFDIGTVDGYENNGVYINRVISVGENTVTLQGAADGATQGLRKTKFYKTGLFAFSAVCDYIPRLILKLRSIDGSIWMTDSDTSIQGWNYLSFFGGWYKDGTQTTARNVWLFTIPEGIGYFQIVLAMSGDAQSGTNYTFKNIMLEECSTATSYEPYRSSNATIQFGQTVYGGRSNFTDGGTDDEYEYADDLDAWSWTAEGEGYFFAIVSDAKLNGKITCSMYKGVQKLLPDNGEIAVTNSQATPLLRIKDPTCYGYSASQFAAHLSGCQLAYEKVTPSTIATPPTDLKLLKGTNNITTNGTTINLGYQPDNVIGEVKGEIEKCAVDAEFMQFTDGTDTFTDVNLSLDASFHSVSVVGSKIAQKRFICFEVIDKRGGVLQGILASCIAFTDGAKTPSGTAFRAYIESLQMYVNFRIYGSGGSYTLAYQSETSFSTSAFYVRVRMMNNL